MAGCDDDGKQHRGILKRGRGGGISVAAEEVSAAPETDFAPWIGRSITLKQLNWKECAVQPTVRMECSAVKWATTHRHSICSLKASLNKPRTLFTSVSEFPPTVLFPSSKASPLVRLVGAL